MDGAVVTSCKIRASMQAARHLEFGSTEATAASLDNSQTHFRRLIEMSGWVGPKRSLLGAAAPCHPEPVSRLREQAIATGEGSLHEMPGES